MFTADILLHEFTFGQNVTANTRTPKVLSTYQLQEVSTHSHRHTIHTFSKTKLASWYWSYQNVFVLDFRQFQRSNTEGNSAQIHADDVSLKLKTYLIFISQELWSILCVTTNCQTFIRRRIRRILFTFSSNEHLSDYCAMSPNFNIMNMISNLLLAKNTLRKQFDKTQYIAQ